MKSKQNEEILDGLKDCCDSQKDSLIGILNNPIFGSLTVPSSTLMKLLVYIESKFREVPHDTNIFQAVFESLNVHYISHVFPEILSNDDVNALIAKISAYFIKIRCYQKARRWNSKLNVGFDQNMSL